MTTVFVVLGVLSWISAFLSIVAAPSIMQQTAGLLLTINGTLFFIGAALYRQLGVLVRTIENPKYKELDKELDREAWKSMKEDILPSKKKTSSKYDPDTGLPIKGNDA